MNSKAPLSGLYSSKLFVTVHGEQARQELRLLGCYGQDLESARRKDEERRGPLDRLLLEEVDHSPEPTSTMLTLHEAYYLAYALGCLKINTTSGDHIDLDTCWMKFRQDNSHLGLDFAIEYAVYHYFRSRGWTVKSGLNYGTNFLLYREGPPIDHAQYAVQILYEARTQQQPTGLNWKSLLATHRVIQSVCKDLLLVHVIPKERSETYNKPSCIRDMSIAVEGFFCKTNLML